MRQLPHTQHLTISLRDVLASTAPNLRLSRLRSEGFRRLMDQRSFLNGVKRSFIVPEHDEDHPGFCFLPRRCPNGTNDRGPADSHDRGRTGNSSQCSVFESSTRRTIPAIVGWSYRTGIQRADSLSLLLGIP